jgi:hypothetical protein
MDLETFITRWQGRPGGAERANFPPFISEFCRALGLPEPEPASANTLSDYGFEAPVRPDAAYSDKTRGRIDLYKRRCFVLEAKQSRLADGEPAPDDAPPPIAALPPDKNLFGEAVATAAAARPKPAPRKYDRLMEDALAQAKGYALALPPEHGWPPFLIVCDVGRAFELHFDWAGNGKGYGFFPDQKSYRIELADLRSLSVQALLRGVWTDPASVDPRRRAVAVTREIAGRLAKVSARLEKDIRKDHADADSWALALGIEESSLFLMRILFCMFAEDVGLLPTGKFEAFLESARTRSDRYWFDGLTDLWSRMGDNSISDRWWSFGDAIVRHFNGNLFHQFRVLKVPVEEKGELLAAAKCDWKSVEPAIFGTLLEQALTATERAKLGAHYTPRPYVERLVDATIMDVLRAEWDAVRQQLPPPPTGAAGRVGRVGVGDLPPGTIAATNPETPHPNPPHSPAAPGGERAEPSLAAATAFHARLAALKILDPACGTGNFLYVAMEQLLRLESQVIVLIGQLGGQASPIVSPNQFLGLELNPRAAVIAELVLWIGWLRYRLANEPDSIGEPVLPPLHNINFGKHGGYDALLAASAIEPADLANPRPAAWPEADFIIGNPPFIGKGAAMRGALGNDYVEALWQAYPTMPASADLVMFWWDKAATITATPGGKTARFGLVTTNSITGVFNRRVVERFLTADPPLSLLFAVPDHPWTSAGKDSAAVRIAMTVAGTGKHVGNLAEVTGEIDLGTENPQVDVATITGRINSDLTIGSDTTATRPLRANDGIACNGMMLAGQGFKLSASEAAHLVSLDGASSTAVVRPYCGGGELLGLPQGRFVIDLFGLTEAEARQTVPAIYQHLLVKVKPERDANRDLAMKKNWWLFGRNRQEHRAAINDLRRYIGTTETSKHRVFQFIDVATVPDHMVVAIASEDAFHHGVLSSRLHTEWVLRTGAWLGVGNDNRYSKSLVFDPFPFPDATPAQRTSIAALAEELDMTRRLALDENPGLTMTGLYNIVASLRSGTVLTPEQEAAATRARARIVAKLHADIDTEVAAAYGWPADLAPADIVTRLVALNAARAAEEAAGHIRWLRPDYQAGAKDRPA